MYEQQKAAPGGYPGTADIAKSTGANNYATEVVRGQPARLPAYAKNLRPRPDRSLLVITGRSGWSLFDRGGTTNAILLPDPNPAVYRWPDLSGWADGLLIDRTDDGLTSDQTKVLALTLLKAGLPRVVTDLASFYVRVQA